MIPEAAVEAAAFALSECGSLVEWEDQGRHFKSTMRRQATRVLEAAAPHIAAQALREAASDPGLRLSGHSGVSISRLKTRAAMGDALIG